MPSKEVTDMQQHFTCKSHQHANHSTRNILEPCFIFITEPLQGSIQFVSCVGYTLVSKMKIHL